MKKRTVLLAVTMCALACLAACGRTEEQIDSRSGNYTFTDDYGREVTV